MFGQIHERIVNERKKVIMLKHIKVTNSLNSWVKLLKESLLMYVINDSETCCHIPVIQLPLTRPFTLWEEEGTKHGSKTGSIAIQTLSEVHWINIFHHMLFSSRYLAIHS